MYYVSEGVNIDTSLIALSKGLPMSQSTRPPTVLFASLGGTITMTGSNGVVPSLTADDVIAAAPGIEKIASIHATTVETIPGASLTFDHLEKLLTIANQEVDNGAQGIVLAQGTDTIEETAFYLDLRWSREAPLIVTGAMRTLQALSADGPSNLSCSMTVASDESAQGIGTVVVLNEEVHAAARVRKQHATSLAAFQSPTGPLGYVIEGKFEKTWQGPRTVNVPAPIRGDIQIAALGTGLDDDGASLAAVVQAGIDGVVIDAFGVGHLPERVADVIGKVSTNIPVVVSTRTGAGRTLRQTYGFPGSERDLAARGAILSGWLDARKSRILLRALLAAGTPMSELRDAFEAQNRM